MKLLSTILVATTLTACGTQVARVENTPSGRPEVHIENVNLDTVRERLIERVMGAGYSLDADSPTRLVTSIPMQGMQESLTRMALSNSYATPVRTEVAYTLVKTANGVRIYAQPSISSTMAFGQVRKIDWNGNASFNTIQESLKRLRDSFANSK